MRIVYVFRSLAVWGGIERILVDKMNYLVSKYGYEVHMITTDQGNHPIPYKLDPRVHFQDVGIRFHQQYHYSGFKRLFVAWKLNRLFKKRLRNCFQSISPDVILCTTSNDVNTIVRIKGSVPLIVESHSIYKETFGRKGFLYKLKDKRLRKSLYSAHMIVTLTHADAEEWRKKYKNVCCIPNIVHLNDSKISHDLSSKHVIFVGRLDYQKRAFDAIRIWEEVHTRFPDWILDIYGEGEQQELIETIIEKKNINVVLHQPVFNIFDCYNKSAFLIMTSLFEPFGLVIPEAMSCGLPVVAFDCPYGPADIITDGVDGFLIKNRDIEVFANKVCQLIEDDYLRRQMGQNGIASSQRYRAGTLMTRWISLFDKLSFSQ